MVRLVFLSVLEEQADQYGPTAESGGCRNRIESINKSLMCNRLSIKMKATCLTQPGPLRTGIIICFN